MQILYMTLHIQFMLLVGLLTITQILIVNVKKKLTIN